MLFFFFFNWSFVAVLKFRSLFLCFQTHPPNWSSASTLCFLLSILYKASTEIFLKPRSLFITPGKSLSLVLALIKIQIWLWQYCLCWLFILIYPQSHSYFFTHSSMTGLFQLPIGACALTASNTRAQHTGLQSQSRYLYIRLNKPWIRDL